MLLVGRVVCERVGWARDGVVVVGIVGGVEQVGLAVSGTSV